MQFSDRALSYAKQQPHMVLGGVITFVALILILVVIFSLYRAKPQNITDSVQKKHVINAKRAAIGVGVLTLISAAMAAMYMMKMRK
jgi:ABC-type sulfate transport system permease component